MGSRPRYLPFGGYRPGSAPTQTITDRDFTGQRENMELGLLYYGARFYVPGLGRFASADTVVPNPANPQSYNRYSYVLNRALNFTDPTGHRECDIADPLNCGGGPSSFTPPEPQLNMKDFSEQDINYIIMTVYADSGEGRLYPPEVIETLTWVLFNRVSPGDVFSNLDSANRDAACAPQNLGSPCGSWGGVIQSFLDDGLTYAAATLAQREAALQEAIACYSGEVTCGASSIHITAYRKVTSLVRRVYGDYESGVVDPTHGSIEFNIQPTHRKMPGGGYYDFPSGKALYGWMRDNFEAYAQENPGFQYTLSRPFGARESVALTANQALGCVADGTCGWTP
ncbi:MAG: hypothetical protein HND44_18335 [Chloroflexi bacterium]|nr:hypothetical protein [Ardenticatenaceae bacterium]NOG36507.1 hypothetical protein [Chloroflexota bacterium]